MEGQTNYSPPPKALQWQKIDTSVKVYKKTREINLFVASRKWWTTLSISLQLGTIWEFQKTILLNSWSNHSHASGRSSYLIKDSTQAPRTSAILFSSESVWNHWGNLRRQWCTKTSWLKNKQYGSSNQSAKSDSTVSKHTAKHSEED